MTIYLDKIASITPYLRSILCDKGTEQPFIGDYTDTPDTAGSYLCRRCGIQLFTSDQQFHSGCGWASFDDALLAKIEQRPDTDGQRTEILCQRCHSHLGHVFQGEGFTAKNTRHCVNSASLDFIPFTDIPDTEEAIVAGGCFWGVEYYLNQLPGVCRVESGYTGGHLEAPTYDRVCQGNTGHYEAVRVIYDPLQISYRKVIQRFFEIHDPTQVDGQGPDIGTQYQSAVFYYNPHQRTVTEGLIAELKNLGYNVATKCLPIQSFWAAERFHQQYYSKHQTLPYCHRPEDRFNTPWSKR